ncbi:PREDICTED: pentatricopeptide repeat-containing protein At4g18520-like [Lupinus angustifolius]|uniref:pentatricopeptide repeat-containing protein At4g18520-like n=1 Tax=Lupinus angustifolius TaxID=3871 RepID=UPI00092FA15C|nr:PREDICTED: pentatricopeptide repeat-containing protein At4g18520-like [Lupinus angustifolius]
MNELNICCQRISNICILNYNLFLAFDTNAVPNCFSKGLSCSSTPGCNGSDEKNNDDDNDTWFLDDYQLISDCDKLIEAFVLDKSALIDWRRVLVLNKKWNNIRHHFFKHCQDRADNEKDPMMKNKLLWLGMKLKEIDEDVQRYSELMKMIKGTPSDISEVVSRCHKDFTKEFLVHLHTVAESFDDPRVQNDLVKLRDACFTGALKTAELNSPHIISSHLDTVCRNIDNLDGRSQCFNPDSVARLLRSCYNVKEIGMIHAVVLKRFRDSIIYVDNNLICSYLRLGKLAQARRVFDGMSRRNTVTWTAMIDGYLNFNLVDEAFMLFQDSTKHGVQENSTMFVCFMNLCRKRMDLKLGKQIHARVLKSNWRNLIVDNTIIHFYAKCGEISSAFQTFDCMAERDLVCWTTMITACSQHGLGHEALLMLSQMLGDGFLPNEYTICSALKACGENKALKFGTQLHGALVKKICKIDVFIGTSLLGMYAKCGETVNSKKVFDRMRIRNTATWTSIISGYARNGLGEEAISVFRLMMRRKVHVNKLTIVSVMMACGSIKALLFGREVHAQVIKSINHTNLHIGSTLVWFYCKCKEYSHAIKVLQHMPFRDVVSWTAIISGCTKLGLKYEALECLQEMMEEGVLPNSYTYSSALKACANLESPTQGKLIHSNASKTPALSNVFVNSSLISMYVKCGNVADAFQVFDNMPKRNLVSWKAMILGYVRNGHYKEALKLMYRMEAEGFVVDDYIHANVFTACGGIDAVDID